MNQLADHRAIHPQQTQYCKEGYVGRGVTEQPIVMDPKPAGNPGPNYDGAQKAQHLLGHHPSGVLENGPKGWRLAPSLQKKSRSQAEWFIQDVGSPRQIGRSRINQSESRRECLPVHSLIEPPLPGRNRPPCPDRMPSAGRRVGQSIHSGRNVREVWIEEKGRTSNHLRESGGI